MSIKAAALQFALAHPVTAYEGRDRTQALPGSGAWGLTGPSLAEFGPEVGWDVLAQGGEVFVDAAGLGGAGDDGTDRLKGRKSGFPSVQGPAMTITSLLPDRTAQCS